jgi:fluoroacetyl-CoA thioesterase
VSVKGGVHAVIDHVVEEADTAAALHSGDVAVLGTPRVVSLCEEASLAALAGLLDPSQTSVGCRVEVAHFAPVAVGTKVRAAATLEKAEGRRLVFNVSVFDASGLIAAGKVTRVIVERDAFLKQAR